MDPQFKTSFIPKKTVPRKPRTSPLSARGGTMTLTFLATLILLVIAVLATAGIFFYQQFTERNIARKGEELERARAQVEPALIEEMKRAATRIDTAQKLLGKHVATSRLFDFLQNNTLQGVQFRKLAYELLPDGTISVSLNGRARSFSAVALQSDVFGDTSVLQDPVFFDLNVDQQGDVVFSVAALVDPAALSYKAGAKALPAGADAADALESGTEAEAGEGGGSNMPQGSEEGGENGAPSGDTSTDSEEAAPDAFEPGVDEEL